MNAILHHGDCLKVLPTLQGVDAVVTDPPYGIALTNNDRHGHTRRVRPWTIAGDKDGAVALAVLEWAAGRRLPIVAFASPWKPWPGKWRNLIVWDKGGCSGGGDIQTCLKRSWELIQVARNGPMNGGRANSVWRFPISPQATVDHIAAKPVPLMCALIERFTQPGDTILDPFMGSGSTGVACLRTGRRFIGIECDPTYFEIARRRIAEEEGKHPLFQGVKG